MVLDKKKANQIYEPFEREVYEILLKLDKKVEFFDVDVSYHQSHQFEGQSSVIPDFQIYFRNKDKQHLILLECKHHSDTSGNMMKDLEGFVVKFHKISKKYEGTDYVLKPIFLVKIDNKESIPVAIQREATKYGIPCYESLLIDQLSEAIDALSPGVAFLEFLHSYCGIDMVSEPTSLSFRCLKNQNFDKPTFTFSMPANDLIRIAYVNRANVNKKDLAEAYQRAIKKKRLGDIAKFVLEQQRKSKIEVFPNNIVVNLHNSKFVPDQIDPNFGTLEIPNTYGSLWVIDGQHRLYSFCKINDEHVRDTYRFIVTAYPEISLSDQAEIFYTINDKQEGINSDLIMFILAQLMEKTEGYAAKVLLSVDKEEFFSKPVKKGFEEKERGAWLKLSTLTNSLTEEKLIDCEKPSGGLLQKNREDLDTPLRILKAYLGYIRKHFRTSWDDGKKGFAQSNQGLSIMFIILRKIVEAKTKTKDDLDDIDEDTFEDYLDRIDSRKLNTRQLVGRKIGDIRSKTDRREVAKELWNLIK
jgi:DGQHR domain-containing protein